MKTFPTKSGSTGQLSRSGFTLLEMMVASFIFIVLMGAAMVAVQIFGLRVYTLAATKISATTSGRETLNDFRDCIHSCNKFYIGMYTNGTFTQIANGLPQVGNAVQIYASTNTPASNTIVFYMDVANTNLSMTNFGTGAFSVEANYITNYLCFQAEDYTGTNILTSYQNDPVVDLTMDYYQWEYPIGYVGGSGANAYDFYRLRTRVERRAVTNP